MDPQKKMKTIVQVFVVLLVGVAVAGVVSLFLKWWIVAGICLLVSSLFFLRGFERVQTEDRMVVEVFGEFYKIKGPGLTWNFPFVVLSRATVPTWEQPVMLFTDKPSIDFKGGGTVVLVGPTIWVRTIGALEENENIIKKNVTRMVYAVDDWEGAIREAVETAFRSLLNNLTVDEALKKVFAKGESWWEIVKRQFTDLEGRLNNWGVQPTKITVSDLNLGDEVVRTRQRVFEEERSIEIAKFSVQAVEQESTQKGLEFAQQHVAIVERLKKGLPKLPQKELNRIAAEYVKYRHGADTGRLIDIRMPGGGGFSRELVGTATAIAAALKQGQGASDEESGKTEPQKGET